MRNLTKIQRKRLKKHFLQAFLLLTLLFFTSGMPDVQAASARALASHGNLVYGGTRGGASLYAADILLLEEKISTIPEQCFDPVCYTHTHHWEYCQINEKTHTRHCADCKENGDLTSPHRIDRWERDTIFYEGKTYAGKRYTCVCGYQWCMEQSHTMICEPADETSHQIRCALDKTSYCQGCEPFVEEHYVWYYEMNEDKLHHKQICYDCGFQIEQICSFDYTDDEGRRVCICGNCETQDDSESPDVRDESEEPEKTDPSDSPDTEDAPQEPETPDPPDTGDDPDESEKPEETDPSDTEDDSGESEGPEIPDLPDTGDDTGESEEPEAPDAGDMPEETDPSDTGNSSTLGIEGGL